MEKRRICVVGAGLTGTLVAARMADAGHDVDIYDRRADLRRLDLDGGRSINLALSERGFDALDRIGIADDIRAAAVPMRGRMMHSVGGELTFQPYGTDPSHVLMSVNRDDLNIAMLNSVDSRPNITAHYGVKLVTLDPDHAEVTLEADDETSVCQFDTVIGADGAFSAVRQVLQRSQGFDFEQDFLEHGYKELTIPAHPDGSYQIEPHALHIWPRGTHMMIALPNPDGSFTCTLFWPLQGEVGFGGVDTPDAVVALFNEQFPDAVALMPDLAQDYLQNPVGTLVTIRCAPWYRSDTTLILGDAAHAVVPFYGQGANAAMEDCTLLMDSLARHGDDWIAGFADFADARKPHADALADLALANYVEMRDHVASPRFLLLVRIKQWLHKVAPKTFTPLYTMVTFTRTPYADAIARARRQDRYLQIAAWVAALVVIALVGVLAIGLVGVLAIGHAFALAIGLS